MVRATQPFERIAADFKGPLPRSKSSKNRVSLTIVDVYSRFVWAFPCKDTSTGIAIKIYHELLPPLALIISSFCVFFTFLFLFFVTRLEAVLSMALVLSTGFTTTRELVISSINEVKQFMHSSSEFKSIDVSLFLEL